MNAWLSLFRAMTTEDGRRLALFAGLGLLAAALGFVTVSPATAAPLIMTWGYYYMLGLFVLFVFFAWRVAAPRRSVWIGWLRAPGWPGAVILLATAFALWADPFQHKILFDEYVLQGTAFQLHATKEIGTVVRAYDLAGTWLPFDRFLDKRPYFFAFLVSLIHDLTGYRLANLFALNVALTPVFFGLVYWLGRTLAGRGPALLAVGLLGTMPLMAQQASGAGMELHNLTMIALAMALAVLYLRAPDADRLTLLVLGALLLAQSRYESVLFVGSVAVVVLVGWRRAGRVLLPWPVLLAPLLLVPYAWHNRVLSANPVLWQLQEGQAARFAARYLAGNLDGAWRFFFNHENRLANSWYLSALGAAGAAWALARGWRRLRAPRGEPLSPGVVAVIAFGAGIAGNLALLMFYYWSRLDDFVASRFALPMCLLLALLAARALAAFDARGWPATRVAAIGLGAWLLGWGAPALSHRFYTDENLVMQEVTWEHDILRARPGPLLYVTNKSTIPFVLWRISSIVVASARDRGEQIRYHLGEGTFREVIVSQTLRPTAAEGRRGVDPDDVMPENFRLEPIAEKRFGGRWIRLSRLTVVEAARPPKSAPAGSLTP